MKVVIGSPGPSRSVFSHEELSDAFGLDLLARQCTNSRLSCVDPSRLASALGNAVAFLLNDRLTTGKGRGGWGKSDRVHMANTPAFKLEVQQSVRQPLSVFCSRGTSWVGC